MSLMRKNNLPTNLVCLRHAFYSGCTAMQAEKNVNKWMHFFARFRYVGRAHVRPNRWMIDAAIFRGSNRACLPTSLIREITLFHGIYVRCLFDRSHKAVVKRNRYVVSLHDCQSDYIFCIETGYRYLCMSAAQAMSEACAIQLLLIVLFSKRRRQNETIPDTILAEQHKRISAE